MWFYVCWYAKRGAYTALLYTSRYAGVVFVAGFTSLCAILRGNIQKNCLVYAISENPWKTSCKT
ncbi:hypothetical protein FZI24_03610 [Cronobacter sakazakii]|nr:hypothetical protein FZI24_03610 [Cronobacter sakazakii]